jgi:hypothetical protein
MAHFAKIGLNNKVIEIQVISNEVLKDSSGVEREELGIQFLNELTGWPIWKQTSYNNKIRKNYASIGYTYNEDKDAFISKKPYNSWILNEISCHWEAPIAYPATYTQNLLDGKGNKVEDGYFWNESTKTWDLIS